MISLDATFRDSGYLLLPLEKWDSPRVLREACGEGTLDARVGRSFLIQ